MIVCDRCKSLKSKAFPCKVTVDKCAVHTTPDKPPSTNGYRQIIQATPALCDACIGEVCKIIGKILKGQKS